MKRRICYSSHALQRLSERGIQRRWVEAVARTQPRCYGHQQVFTLSARAFALLCGVEPRAGFRLVMDGARRCVVTACWLDRGQA